MMGWDKAPVSVGEEVDAEAISEVRLAIIERRRATGLDATAGLGDPPSVSQGDICQAQAINTCREAVENLIPRYIRTDGSGQNWTKASILQEALGAGRTEWTNVPLRAGTAEYGATLPAGTVMYAEHVNEMKEVIDLLYIVRIEEKEGQEYCRNTGADWTWSTTDYDTSSKARTTANHQAGGATQTGESAPFDFYYTPVGDVGIAKMMVRGNLSGVGEDLRAKFVNFVNGDEESQQPTDREWNAELRVSTARPEDSPRGADTEPVYENNLADDGSHTSDSTNDAPNNLEVYIDDTWGPEEITGISDEAEWPFWLTFIIDDHEQVESDYAAEAEASDRELQIFEASVHFNVIHIWAELEMEYCAS